MFETVRTFCNRYFLLFCFQGQSVIQSNQQSVIQSANNQLPVLTKGNVILVGKPNSVIQTAQGNLQTLQVVVPWSNLLTCSRFWINILFKICKLKICRPTSKLTIKKNLYSIKTHLFNKNLLSKCHFILFSILSHTISPTLPNFLYSRLSLIKEFKTAHSNQAFNGQESPTVQHRYGK